jgi:hypothetical protein
MRTLLRHQAIGFKKTKIVKSCMFIRRLITPPFGTYWILLLCVLKSLIFIFNSTRSSFTLDAIAQVSYRLDMLWTAREAARRLDRPPRTCAAVAARAAASGDPSVLRAGGAWLADEEWWRAQFIGRPRRGDPISHGRYVGTYERYRRRGRGRGDIRPAGDDQ